METVSLTVEARAKDSSAKDLRRESIVPCVLYGNDTDNIPIQCEHNELFRTYAKAGASTIVELAVGSKKVPVLFHAIDFHPVTEKIIHVDFYAVDMKKKIEARIPIEFTGESSAVKEQGGVFVTVRDSLRVSCLPADLPHALEADITSLVEFGDSISVASIPVPEGVEIMTDAKEMIANVQEPRRIEEELPVEAAEGEEGEVVEGEEGEATESEGAEGEGEKAEEGSEGGGGEKE